MSTLRPSGSGPVVSAPSHPWLRAGAVAAAMLAVPGVWFIGWVLRAPPGNEQLVRLLISLVSVVLVVSLAALGLAAHAVSVAAQGRPRPRVLPVVEGAAVTTILRSAPESPVDARSAPLRIVTPVPPAMSEHNPVTLPSPVPPASKEQVLEAAALELHAVRKLLAGGNLGPIAGRMQQLEERARAVKLPIVAQASRALYTLIRNNAPTRHVAVSVVGLTHVVETLRRQLAAPGGAVLGDVEVAGPESQAAQSGLRPAVRLRDPVDLHAPPEPFTAMGTDKGTNT